MARVARNRIVKQGDLEATSTARESLQAAWGQPAALDLEVPPTMATDEVAAHLMSMELPVEARESGVLVVERRWVAVDLPDRELLDVIAEGYGAMATLIAEAHERGGFRMQSHSFDPQHEVSWERLPGRLPCMVATRAMRSVIVNLKTRTPIVFDVQRGQPDRATEDDAAVRYGLTREVLQSASRDVLDVAEVFSDIAKRILVKDKDHSHTAPTQKQGRDADRQVLVQRRGQLRRLLMGWGFRKSKTIGPGLRLNLSKRSAGLSAGRRGARVSGNTRGRKSVSLSWKGLFWRKWL